MLLNFHFNREKINMVKEDLIKFDHIDLDDVEIRELKEKYIQFPRVSLLLVMHYLYVNDEELKVQQFDRFIFEIIGYHIEEHLEDLPAYHPVRELIVENHRFRNWIYRINEEIGRVEPGCDEATNAEMNDLMYSLGQLYNQYHVIEKLVFPVLERYGHRMFTRDMWREDDRIRGLYQSDKKMIAKANFRKSEDVQLTFRIFEE